MDCMRHDSHSRLTCIHGHTAHFWPLSQPARPACLAQRCEVGLGVAGDAYGAAGIRTDLSKLAALQPDNNMPGLGPCARVYLVAVYNDGIRTCAAAEDAPTTRLGADVEDLRAQRDHVDGKTVTSCGCFGGQHTGIHEAAHTLDEVLRDAGAVALYLVTSAHAIGGNNVRLLSRLEPGDEGQVGAAVGVVLYPVDDMPARQVALVVDDAYSALVAATTVPHRDPARVVPAAQVLPLPRDGQLEQRPPFPQMVVDGPLEMAQAGRAGLVGAQRDVFFLARALCLQSGAVGCKERLRGRGCGCGRGVDGLGVSAGKGAGSQERSPQARGPEVAYPRLQHGDWTRTRAGTASRGRQWAVARQQCRLGEKGDEAGARRIGLARPLYARPGLS